MERSWEGKRSGWISCFCETWNLSCKSELTKLSSYCWIWLCFLLGSFKCKLFSITISERLPHQNEKPTDNDNQIWINFNEEDGMILLIPTKNIKNILMRKYFQNTRQLLPFSVKIETEKQITLLQIENDSFQLSKQIEWSNWTQNNAFVKEPYSRQ